MTREERQQQDTTDYSKIVECTKEGDVNPYSGKKHIKDKNISFDKQSGTDIAMDRYSANLLTGANIAPNHMKPRK